MTTDYWTQFWVNHARASRNRDAQSQVLRTLGRQPVSAETFAAVVETITSRLEVSPHHDLLDLCCGNGAITRQLVGKVRSITAVDLAEEFVEHVRRDSSGAVRALVADARAVDFAPESFDRILLYAGLQYFSEPETVELLGRLRRWLRPGGRALLGDVPDTGRRWSFFDSADRENSYFAALQRGEPIIGQWFEPDWLQRLARHAGFGSSTVLAQPPALPYHHYRFDLVLTV